MIDLILEIALSVSAFGMFQAWRLERSRRQELERALSYQATRVTGSQSSSGVDHG